MHEIAKHGFAKHAAGVICLVVALSAQSLSAEQNAPRKAKPTAEAAVAYPPRLPGGKAFVSDTDPTFLKAGVDLREGVRVAKHAPRVDFMYYPGQDYPGKPWSNWGDGAAVGGKYYSAIGDHLAINRKGDGAHGGGAAMLFAYDPATHKLARLAHTTQVLGLPSGHYTPGKIHSRIELGSDGWLYYSTHRGSARAAIDANHYRGDWILRTHAETGKTDIVTPCPVAKHSIPASVLDPERLIFYGATAAGPDATEQEIHFFAYDVKHKKTLYSGPNGPARYLALAGSTGRVYFVAGASEGPLMRYDPAQGGSPVEVGGTIGIRAATGETPDGMIYTVSLGQGNRDAHLWSLNTKTEAIEDLGSAAVASQTYVASLDAGPTGRYLYYVPGAHGGSSRDGSAVVQFDTKTRRRKVLAFLHPFYQEKYGAELKGTYSTAVDPAGDTLYVTWNVSRGSRAWDSCGLTVIHIPAEER